MGNKHSPEKAVQEEQVNQINEGEKLFCENGIDHIVVTDECNDCETRERRGAFMEVQEFLRTTGSRILSSIRPSRSSRKIHVPDPESKESSQEIFPDPDRIHEISYSIWELFEDEGEIGKGGYGKIFSVSDKRTGIKYAMKMMKISDARVFVKELKCLRLLEAETNIVNYFGVYRDPWFCYLLMEKSISGDLYEYSFANGSPTDEKHILGMMKSILQSISQCHQNNICHRDVKPENLLLFPKSNFEDKETGIEDYDIKLIDFGMSEIMETMEDQEFELDISRAHTGLGTVSYLSPEIIEAVSSKTCLSAEQLCKSDVWAAGATVYFLYTQGFHAFPQNKQLQDENARAASVKALICEGTPRKPYWMSMDLWSVIQKLLTVDVEQRVSAENALELECFTHFKGGSTPFSKYICIALSSLDSISNLLLLFSIQFFSQYFQEMDSFAVLQWMRDTYNLSSGKSIKTDYLTFDQFKIVLKSLSKTQDASTIASLHTKLFDSIRSWDSAQGLRCSYRDGVSVNHLIVLMLLGQFLSEPGSLAHAFSLFKQINPKQVPYFTMEELEEFVSSQSSVHEG